MFIWIYRLMYLPVLLLSSPYYLKRMLARGGYAKHFMQRLGFIPPLPQKCKKRIWIQAVSVGEVKSIQPLISKLVSEHEIVLTTTTSTGYEIAHKLYSRDVIHLGIFPLDFVFFSSRTWNAIDPDLVLLMESELWPEHLHQANSRKTPAFLINARMSDRSFSRYRRVAPIATMMLNQLSYMLASSQQDLERYIALGADPKKCELSGNLKFDAPVHPVLSAEDKQKLKMELGFISTPDEPCLVLTGASTWPGEEATLLLAYEEAKKHGIPCKLLIIPRHAERRDEIQSLLETQNRPWHLRSHSRSANNPVEIYLADTTGELTQLIQASDLVFIGKSLPPNHGGQTPVEAAALSLPIFFGSRMNNFKDIASSLETEKAAIVVEDANEAIQAAVRLLTHKDERTYLAQQIKKWYQFKQGATEQIITTIKQAFK